MLVQLQYKEVDGLHVFSLRGDLTSPSLQSLKKKIVTLTGESGSFRVLFNMKLVDYITSKDLGVFVLIFRYLEGACHESGGVGESYLALCHLNPFVQDVIEMTKLESVFRIYDTEESALEDLT